MRDLPIKLYGKSVPTGCYLLVIQLGSAQNVTFGRFNQGGAVFLPAGTYLYVGSARGEKGSSSLGARLMRHATRCDPANPHTIREILLAQLQNAGIQAKVPAQKRCHWHIDYLLELPQAEITDVVIIRTRENLETQLAEEMAALPETTIPTRGLGASDHRGGTHLFHLLVEDRWREKADILIQAFLNHDDGMAKI